MLKNFWIVVVVTILLVATTAFAGWENAYGGSDDDLGLSVVQTNDGGYIVVGKTYSFETGGPGVYVISTYLVKTNADGETLWTRYYSDEGCGYSVAQTTDGGYIIAGKSLSSPPGNTDVYLMKTDTMGNIIWTHTYGGSNFDDGFSVVQTTDGGYIVAGRTSSFGMGSYDVYLIKTDEDGDTVWTRTYGGSGEDCAYSVGQTNDNGYIITGWTSSNVYLIKTDTDGDTVWTRTYSRSSENYGYSVAQTSDGGYIITGSTYPSDVGEQDVYLIKTDEDGDTMWTRTYGGSGWDCGYSVIQTTDDDGYLVAGQTPSFGAGEFDVYLIKTNSSGDTVWTRTYGGTSQDQGRSVMQTTDGGYIIAGMTYSFGAGGYDVYLVKVDPDGVVEWQNSKPKDIFLSASPNPFNATTTISYELPEPGPVSLQIFDTQGRLVTKLISGDKETGVHTTLWDASNVPSGIYFAKLITRSENRSIRMILIK